MLAWVSGALLRTWVGLVVLVGCGHDPTPRHHRVVEPPPPPDTSPLNASADREHPAAMVEREVDGRDGVSIKVRTPGPGSWWFELQLGPQHEGWDGHLRIGAGKDEVKLFLVTGDTELAAAPAIEMDDNGPRRLLLRVETDRALEFYIDESRTYRRANVPDKPRPHHPACELSKPDFRNPNCCQAKCQFGRKECTAEVTSAPKGGRDSLATISIGADFEIMAGAQATLSVRGHFVAFGRVLAVGEHSSVVALERISDGSKILKADVVLERPSECMP